MLVWEARGYPWVSHDVYHLQQRMQVGTLFIESVRGDSRRYTVPEKTLLMAIALIFGR